MTGSWARANQAILRCGSSGIAAAVFLAALAVSVTPGACAQPGAWATLNLTAEERSWLEEHPDKLTLFFNTEFPPIEFISGSGEFTGMGADIITMVEERLGVTFRKIPCDDWNLHLSALESGECAIAPTIVYTLERERYAYFTTPYATVPVVIITARSLPGELGLDGLMGLRVGVVSGYATESYLRDRAADSIEVVPVKNVAEGLRAVSFGRLDALVENLAVAAYFIASEGIPNLRVAGRTDYAFAWSIGVSRQYPLLYSAIEKALAAVPKEKIEEVRKRWIHLDADIGPAPETLRRLKVAGLFVALLLVSLAGITFFLKRQLDKNVAGLRKSEEKVSTILNSVDDAVLSFSLKDAGFTYQSPSVERVFGRTLEELQQNRNLWAESVHPDDIHIIQDMYNRLGGADFFDVEYRIVRPDESIIWVRDRVKVIHDAAGEPDRVDRVITDITGRKETEEALAEERRRLEFILSITKTGIDIIDAEYNLHYVDPGWQKVYGDPSGRKCYEYFMGFCEPCPRCGIPKALETKQIIITEETLLKEHNRVVEVHTIPFQDAKGRWLVAEFNIDITERKRAEGELRQSEEKLSSILNAVEDVIGSFSIKKGELIYISPSAEKIYGRDLGEFKENKNLWIEAIHPDDALIVEDMCRQLESKSSAEAEFRIVRPDGGIRWVRNRSRIIYDQQGKPERIDKLLTDITGRKHAEQEREKLQAQLNQAQKMESVGRLAGGVAHDFNNMLQAILGYAELAIQEVRPDSGLHAHLLEIQKAAQRSSDLTRQLLAFARRQTISPRMLDLNETVESMLRMLRRLIGEDIDLAWLPGSGLGPVNMDPSQIDQTLANLCVNARDAIAGVGKVTIETGSAVFDNDYCAHHPGFMPGDYVLLAVSDNGCGMDAETLAKLFEPFFTTKETGKGTGLGLATIYGIVKQNRGFINVYSEPGRGTTFKIYLPRHEGAGAPEQVPDRAAAELRGDETILLVEDELAILTLTTTMLEMHGYTVLGAGTPDEAIRLAKAHPETIHLLVTDVIMPGMNGSELSGTLLSHCPGMKSLFMSGYTANVIAHHGVLDPGVHFIQKPFSMHDLAARVREVLDEK